VKPLKIAIFGCGYLGTELAILLAKKGCEITVITSSPKKVRLLSRLVQKTCIYNGTDNGMIAQILAENDVIVLTFSANRHGDIEQSFLKTAQFIKQNSLEMKVSKTLIYTSNCSVYGNHNGLWVKESSLLKAATLEGKILIETENTYLSLIEQGWQICIFRLAEIYGSGREISKKIKELQGKVLPGTGKNFTNMVHEEDVIHAIDYALIRELKGIYNLCDDDHPTQKEFYDMIAKKFHLQPIDWDVSLNPLNGNKRISNSKIKKEGFKFSYPHHLII
jgi:nucleoside-diphosphate-sugar epimerase